MFFIKLMFFGTSIFSFFVLHPEAFSRFRRDISTIHAGPKPELQIEVPKEELPAGTLPILSRQHDSFSHPLDCYPKKSVLGCMYGVGYMDWDHRCSGKSSVYPNHVPFLNKLGTLHYLKLNTTPISTCLFGDIGFTEMIPCTRVESFLATKSFPDLKGNVLIVMPLLKESAEPVPCPEVSRKFSFLYSPDGLLGRADFFSGFVGDYVYRRRVPFQVNFTSQGRSDPLRYYTGFFDPTPFWQFVQSIQINCKKCLGFKTRIRETLKYAAVIGTPPSVDYQARQKKSSDRSKRSLPEMTPISLKPTQAKCNEIGYVLMSPSYVPQACEALNRQFGNSWMFCSFQDTSHCNFDQAGDWEDGGIHEHCLQTISEFVSEITRCGFLQLLQRSDESDKVIRSIISKLTGTIEAQEDQVELALKQLGQGLGDNLNLRDQIVRVNADISSLAEVIDRILMSYNVTGDKIDVTLRKLELLSLGNQVKIIENTRFLNLTAEFINHLNLTSEELKFDVYHPNGTVFSKHVFQEEQMINSSHHLLGKIQEEETKSRKENLIVINRLEREYNESLQREEILERAFQEKLLDTKNYTKRVNEEMNRRAEITKNLTQESISELVQNEQEVVGYDTPRKLFGSLALGFGSFVSIFIIIICICICKASKS